MCQRSQCWITRIRSSPGLATSSFIPATRLHDTASLKYCSRSFYLIYCTDCLVATVASKPYDGVISWLIYRTFSSYKSPISHRCPYDINRTFPTYCLCSFYD